MRPNIAEKVGAIVGVTFREGGLSPPKFLYQSCFSKCIYLASNVLNCIAMIKFLTATWLLTSFWLLAMLYHKFD